MRLKQLYLTLKPRVSRVVLDAFLTVLVLIAAMLVCAAMSAVDRVGNYVGFLFVLAVVFVSRYTEGYFWGVFASFFGVVCVNYVFTYPYWKIDFSMTGYPLTFVTLLGVSLTISTTTTRLKQQERARREIEREAMRADLLRAMSHDIRTPLTSIVGNTAAVLEDRGALSDEQKRSLLRDVTEDAQWLIRMVENILSITRISGAGGLATEYEAAEEIVGVTARKFSKRFPQVDVTVSVPDEFLMVPMDATLIQQVILNLMENAVIHGGASHITLRVAREGENARFCVSDDGRGIDRKRLPTLFDGTFSAGERGGIDGKKNMGIGLSVCRSIVRAHGGAMSAENLSEGGASVRFTLPLKEVNHESEG